MDFIDQIRTIASRINKKIEHLQTEEATKNALVMPFINALGYNVFDPTEVVPEFTADVGTKKGEKVDYAILQDGKPIILFECKCCHTNLDDEHASQLYRYFSVTEAKFGVLTNGIVYRFYTDLEEPNKMDKKSFLEINLLDIKEQLIHELKKFSKSAFNLVDIVTTASDLKYTKEIKKILLDQMNNPDENFVRFFASQIYPKKLTQSVKDQFRVITKHAFHQFINDRVNDRLKSALEDDDKDSNNSDLDESSISDKDEQIERIITTEEELEGYFIVKSILRETIDIKRIVIRDHINFCNILLDDTIRKPICRMHFNKDQKRLGLFNEQKKKEKVEIKVVDDIYQYADRLRKTVHNYDNPVKNVIDSPEEISTNDN